MKTRIIGCISALFLWVPSVLHGEPESEPSALFKRLAEVAIYQSLKTRPLLFEIDQPAQVDKTWRTQTALSMMNSHRTNHLLTPLRTVLDSYFDLNFTQDEQKKLLEFFNSPIGRKWMDFKWNADTARDMTFEKLMDQEASQHD